MVTNQFSKQDLETVTEMLQKTALLGTARIIKRVMSMKQEWRN